MSIADRITSMSNNLSSAYGRIEYLGVDTSSIDKNLQNLSNALDTVYNEYPKVSDEGVSPSIEGSKVGRLNSTLKASDTTQNSTTGKSLFSPYVYNDPSERNGITCTYDAETQTYTFNGTCTTDNTAFRTGAKNINFTTDTTKSVAYYVSGSVTGFCQAQFFDANFSKSCNLDLSELSASNPTISKTSTSSDFTASNIRVRLNEGSAVNNLKVRFMATDSDDLTYEPYTGGIPSPNPGFPQSIHVVKGNNTVFVGSKNWLPPFVSETQNGVAVSQSGTTATINGVSTAAASISKTYFTLSAGTYRFVTKYKSGTIDNAVQLFINATSDNSRVAGIIFRSTDYTNNKSVGFTLTEQTDVCLVAYIGGSGRTYDNFKFDIQVIKGSTADYDFAEYQPVGICPINLPVGLELCKIGDYQDKLFKAIVGDTIYDTLTSEQKEGLVSGGWYKYEEVGKEILTGNDTSAYTWRKSTMTDMDRFICDYGTRNKYVEQYANSLCNYFTTVTSSTQYAIGNWKNNATYQFVFNYAPYGTTTLEQWRAWVNSNNIVLYQPLITPTITPITDTTLISQLEAWYKAQSKNGQTNILQTNADVPFTIYASALKGE